MGKPTVLITGCSDGGLGSALALELHKTGHRVFATARNPAKLANVKEAGIETLVLDVLSESSIKKCAAEVWQLTGGSLDMLVNNAGANMFVPLVDAPIPDAKKLFDLNVWAGLAMVQEFLPQLLTSPLGGMIVNHTSTASVICPPFSGLYGASKAAMAMFTVSLRAELRPFGVRVVELKTGSTASNLNENQPIEPSVAKSSIYYPAREWLDKLLTGNTFMGDAFPSDVWAKKVVVAITKRSSPDTIWVGSFVWLTWFGSLLPTSISQTLARNAARVDLVEKYIREYGKEKAVADAYSSRVDDDN